MKNNALPLICISLMLFACDQVKDSPGRALNAVEDNTSATWNKMREYAGVPRKNEKPVEHAQARWCYRSYQDIICYGEPIPGQEGRLVAYQGSHGQTGYVIAPPHHASSNHSTAPVSLPPLKAASAGASSGKSDAETPKKEEKKLKEIIFDPAELEPKELVPPKTE